MLYAQFYGYSTGYIPGTIPPQFDPARRELIEGTGDRAVIVLDARVRSVDNGAIAARECKARGYAAWAIFRGDSFSRSIRVSGPHYLNENKPVPGPVWLSAHGM